MLTVAKKAGFCPGVKRSHDFIEKLIVDQPNARIYTLGKLIHNEQYNESLRKRGVLSVTLDEIIDIAKKINTFETSILPYEDCCTVFTPKHPKTRPELEKVLSQEARADLKQLEDEAFEKAEAIMMSSF